MHIIKISFEVISDNFSWRIWFDLFWFGQQAAAERFVSNSSDKDY